jgi:hypothetical protein
MPGTQRCKSCHLDAPFAGCPTLSRIERVSETIIKARVEVGLSASLSVYREPGIIAARCGSAMGLKNLIVTKEILH